MCFSSKSSEWKQLYVSGISETFSWVSCPSCFAEIDLVVRIALPQCCRSPSPSLTRQTNNDSDC